MKYPCTIKLATTDMIKLRTKYTDKVMHGYSRPASVSVVGGSN